jgi:DNA-binding beta-propeller fold protein YncE
MSQPSVLVRTVLPLLLGILLLSGCDLFGGDDDGGPSLETTGVFVANGGNFSAQNGTITVYDPKADQATTPADLALNAFVNSIELHQGRLYAQLNTGFNSGRVNIIDPDSYATTAQSDSLGATRSVAFPEADTTRGYVSTLRGTVRRFDPISGALEGPSINVGPSASELVAADGKVFTTIPDTSLALSDTISNNGSKLAVFDIGSPSSVRTIELGCDGPTAIAQDEEEELAVVCTGRTVFNSNFEAVERTDGAVLFVDPETETVVERIPASVQLGSITGAQVAHYDPASELLHAVSSRNREILRVDTDANARLETISVPEDSSLLGIAATAYDGTTQELYVARTDVQDPFEAAGTVIVFGSSRDVVNRFTVGPAPSHIEIRRQAP